MAYTLIINPGSSSRKYALAEDGSIIYTAHASYKESGGVVLGTRYQSEESDIHTHSLDDALGRVLADILSRGLVPDLARIQQVLLRVVAPGEPFAQHQQIDSSYIARLQEHAPFAPLHIPPLAEEVAAVQELFPDAVLYAISDSAFHAAIPDYLYTLSVDAHDAAEYGIRRFGYHGISASSIVRQLAQEGVSTDQTVVVHFGGGISVHAIDRGQSVQTSMGYDPSSGMAMSTRGGDISAGAMLAFAQSKEMSLATAQEYLYTQCGFKGLVGESDMRRVLEQYEAGAEQAILTIRKLRYEIQSQIAAQATLMGGLSQIVLTGTAFYRNPVLRTLMLEGLEWWGVSLDSQRNHACAEQTGIISPDNSRVAVHVFPAGEEEQMLHIYQEQVTQGQ